MATVQLTPGAAEQLSALPKAIGDHVLKMLTRLETWPTVGGVKKLKGNLTGWYRARVGDYRIRFRVEGDILSLSCAVGTKNKLFST